MTETTPALFDYSVRVYAAMLEEAKPEEIGEITDAAREQGKALETRMVYEGYLTKVFNDLQLSTPYYTSVMNCLKEMHCVVQLRRGGGSATSKWELLTEPTLQRFESRLETGGKNATSMKARVDSLEKRMATLLHNQDVIMRHLGVKL